MNIKNPTLEFDWRQISNTLAPIQLQKAIDIQASELFIDQLFTGGLSSVKVSWRIIPLDKASVREFESASVLASFRHFSNLVRSCKTKPLETCKIEPLETIEGFVNVDLKKNALYADYKHFQEIFPDFNSSVAFNLKNTFYNLPESIDNYSPTLWLGTKGCHTPLHFDNYSVNVVIQHVGTKIWRLWSPKHSKSLSPIRIPYEESSVYCEYDPRIEDRIKPDYEITMNPGDLIFIPKHWWHYVETTSDWALSVNCWIGHPSDSTDRAKEALARLSLGCIVDSLRSIGFSCDVTDGWLNPSELGESLWPMDPSSNLDSELNSVDEGCVAEGEGRGEEEGGYGGWSGLHRASQHRESEREEDERPTPVKDETSEPVIPIGKEWGNSSGNGCDAHKGGTDHRGYGSYSIPDGDRGDGVGTEREGLGMRVTSSDTLELGGRNKGKRKRSRAQSDDLDGIRKQTSYGGDGSDGGGGEAIGGEGSFCSSNDNGADDDLIPRDDQSLKRSKRNGHSMPARGGGNGPRPGSVGVDHLQNVEYLLEALQDIIITSCKQCTRAAPTTNGPSAELNHHEIQFEGHSMSSSEGGCVREQRQGVRTNNHTDLIVMKDLERLQSKEFINSVMKTVIKTLLAPDNISKCLHDVFKEFNGNYS